LGFAFGVAAVAGMVAALLLPAKGGTR
jgi:hypothetical protein